MWDSEDVTIERPHGTEEFAILGTSFMVGVLGGVLFLRWLWRRVL